MKKIVMGILAHVDAGKTTLSEALLYHSGTIREKGRVDKKNAFLDTNQLEKDRGITIFSKQAELSFHDLSVTLLDTPGHVDFSTEMERTLQVLDYAILVISAADGCQGHTETLWKLLNRYQVPTFLFVNKMDQPGADQEKLMEEIKDRLSDSCIDFSDFKADDLDEFYDEVAMTDESLMEAFLENGSVENEDIGKAIRRRNLFPVFFGSALKLIGVEEFMEGMDTYMQEKVYPKKFGARVFKIARDNQDKRLTYLKVTGGTLKARDTLVGNDWEEKVNQIRIYSGTKFQAVDEAKAGMVCAVTGLTKTKVGEGFGTEKGEILPVLEPVLTYKIGLPKEVDAAVILPRLRILEEEDPQLHINWQEELQEIQAQIMGDVQIEILQNMIKERFGIAVTFDEGNIVYKETINNKVEGVGHFEPLRHYAEVHLILEPGERGSGISIDTDVSEDELDKNWQRLIVTHLHEKEHRGVLIGAPITDVKITLVAGRAHKKHTEGGDFRQATYRAVRQGLRQAETVILEPYYDFRMELPESDVGRAMLDVDKMFGTCQICYDEAADPGMTVIKGSAPVACMRGYQREFASYTKGYGRLFCTLKGYDKCHNPEEVVYENYYDPEADMWNPTGSIFCSHGSGVYVEWDQVFDHMHVESVLAPVRDDFDIRTPINYGKSSSDSSISIGEDEIEAIMRQTFYSNTSEKKGPKKRRYQTKKPDGLDMSAGTYGRSPSRGSGKKSGSNIKKEKYLLVDGYNVIFAWEELKSLANVNLDSSRDRLLEILSNYHGVKDGNLIVVFDAYRVKGHQTEMMDVGNIHVVFTKEAQTADAYIEKFAHENSSKYDITVATSDHLEQVIITGAGCHLLSANDLLDEVNVTVKEIRENLEIQGVKERNTIGSLVNLDDL
ncbi:MAG: TetM/TetW/TetO/TetS family tetracycline resistance ribosomal protection protein [Lachnospiraceae bacterium]|nr:TetM/TetW/TetO/TetS family tetracycline resistance ribosomal protection protein [Lachnospiraceae bacterium]